MIKVCAVRSINLVRFESLEIPNAVARPLHCSYHFRTGAPAPLHFLPLLQTPVIHQRFLSNSKSSLNGLTLASRSNVKHPMHDTERRDLRVYIHLYSAYTTNKTWPCLDEFKMIMEARE